MADELFDFAWTFSESGYRIIPGQPGSVLSRNPDSSDVELFVSDAVPLGTQRTVTKYFPLVHHPDLFLKFASLAPESDEIIRFANRFGLLTDDGIFTTEQRNLGIPGEALTFWKHNIAVMHETVSLWTLQKQRSPELHKFIRWRGDRVIYTSHWRMEPLAAPDLRPNWLNRWRKGETNGPTLMALQIIINEHMFRHVGSKLLWNPSGSATDVYVVPKNLLGAMWLQFARALIRSKSYRACQVCEKIMEISTDPHSQARKRSDAILCGEKCRSQKARDRKRALELRKAGQSLSKIKAQLVGKYPTPVLKNDWGL